MHLPVYSFFLEHSRTASHFIKVEEIHRSRETIAEPLTHAYIRASGKHIDDQHDPRLYTKKVDNLSVNSRSLEVPAKHQRPPSILTDLRTSWTHGLFFSNTHTLRCFQISHATKIIKVFRPLRASFEVAVLSSLFVHTSCNCLVGATIQKHHIILSSSIILRPVH